MWQKVAPLAGKSGETIMLAPYPVSQPEKIDADAETFVTTLKESIDAVRNLRGEMNISPALRVPLYFAPSGLIDAVAQQLRYLNVLCKISEAHVVADLPQANAPVAVTSSGKWMLDIKIDADARAFSIDINLDVQHPLAAGRYGDWRIGLRQVCDHVCL